jgi:hypothetical protein
VEQVHIEVRAMLSERLAKKKAENAQTMS